MKNATKKRLYNEALEKIYNFIQKYQTYVIMISSVLYIAWMLIMYPRVHNDAFKMNSLFVSLYAFAFGIRGAIFLMVSIDIFLISYLSVFLGVPVDTYLKDAITGTILCFFLTLFINGLMVMYRKISLLNHELKEMSLSDSLTGLRNRRFFKEVVSELVDHFIEECTNTEVKKREWCASDQIMGICMIDIDFFKNINDTYGHDAGDCVLKELSTIMKSMVRFDDIVIRWGGEEFIILLNRTKIEYLSEFLKSLKDGISRHTFTIGQDLRVNISVSGGCIHYPYFQGTPRKMTFEESIEIADMLLYYGKKTGRNRLIRLKPIERTLDYNALKELLSNRFTENDPEANGDLLEII